MIITIVGTNGAGKSTVVRGLIARATSSHSLAIHPAFEGTSWYGKELGRLITVNNQDIFIPGRYPEDFDTAGCDTIKAPALLYKMIEEMSNRYPVVFEGIRMMNHTAGIELYNRVKDRVQFHIIKLTTPIEDCKASINERRARRGDPPHHGEWRDIEQCVTRANNYAFKLKQLGAKVHSCSRDEALPKILELLK